MGELGGHGAEAYQDTKVGERKAVACPGDDVGLKAACFKLNLAEACPSIDAGECRTEACHVSMQGERRVEAVPGDEVGV